MKQKRIRGLFPLILIFLVFFCSCSDSTLPSSSGVPDPSGSNPEITDKTVHENRFLPTGEETVIPSESLPQFNSCSTVKQLCPLSQFIVYGVVDQVDYWGENGRGNTVYDFIIKQTYKGNLQKNDKISVITAGGYCKLESYIAVSGRERFEKMTDDEIKNTVIQESFYGAPTPEKGDVYVLFLDKQHTGDSGNFPKGMFTETRLFTGRFQQGEDGKFSRYYPKNEPNFYVDPETGKLPTLNFSLNALENEIETYQVNSKTE